MIKKRYEVNLASNREGHSLQRYHNYADQHKQFLVLLMARKFLPVLDQAPSE